MQAQGVNSAEEALLQLFSMKVYNPPKAPPPRPNVVSTGLGPLDDILGGGYPVGLGSTEIIGTDAGVGYLAARLMAANPTLPCLVGSTEYATGHLPGHSSAPGSLVLRGPTPEEVVKMLLPRVPWCRLIIVWTGMAALEILEYRLHYSLLDTLVERANEHRAALVFCGRDSVYYECTTRVRTYVNPANPAYTRVRAGQVNGFGVKLGGVFPR